MPCIETSVLNGILCKYHEGLLYHDDFTSPLAGRYTVVQDHAGDPADKWSIVDVGVLPIWNLSGTKALRIRHDQAENGTTMFIVNDEFPNPYTLDAAGRDFPWFNVKVDVAGVADPAQFPYDLANGGIAHRIHDSNTKYLVGQHIHQCGIFSTWVFIWLYQQGSLLAQSQLVNLVNDWWYLKHHIDDNQIILDQGTPSGYTTGGDHWEPVPQPYAGTNGKFGFTTKTCASWTVDGYVYFHGLRIVETNTVEIRGIPPRPDGLGAEGSYVPGYPLAEGVWVFRCDHPGIGVLNTTETTPDAGATEIVMNFEHHIQTWQKVEWWYYPYSIPGGPALGTPVLIDEIYPTTGVNGGDVYWIGEGAPPAWPPANGGGGEVSVQGGCAEYGQIWLHQPILNDFETGFIPGDTHQYARQIRGFGALAIDGDVTLVVSRARGQDPFITKTSTPNDNGDGSYDITVTFTTTETSQIGDQDAFHFQLQFTLDDGSVVSPNAGLIKGIPFNVNI